MDALRALFTEKARLASAVVAEAGGLDEAFAYTAEACAAKEACRLLPVGCEGGLSDKAADLCESKWRRRVVAAPGLAPDLFARFEAVCAAREIELVADGLHRHLAGIDVGFTVADFGIAETGTLVLESSSEELRLATMICELHVAVLPLSRLRPTAYDLEAELLPLLAPNSYVCFVTGPSRTADIERVLALGVHGPLDLHVLLWEDR
jgi:L-lactate dehydrogenase complex protein LldG